VAVFLVIIGKQLFESLCMNGIQLVTKVKSNMRNSLMPDADKIMLRKRALVETVNVMSRKFLYL